VLDTAAVTPSGPSPVIPGVMIGFEPAGVMGVRNMPGKDASS
jgi:hypothetical protein